jgi:hypothetical protein
LVLNNVLGENQVANGVNISGGVGSGSGSQANNLTQSWGATADISIVTAKGGKGETKVECKDALICKVASASTNGTTARIRQSSAADNIISSSDDATVTYTPTTSVSLTVEAGSQDGLVALVVNNVMGLNQVGNGVNISASSTTVGPNLSVTNSQAGPGSSSQSNVLGAWRGTPSNFTRVP